MRLSEERIEFINQQVLDRLFDDELLEVDGREKAILVEMNRVVIQDLAFEDDLDRQVHEMIMGMKRSIPPGSPEYQAIFLQKKEELAARKNYVI
jgi:hypothetical protein